MPRVARSVSCRAVVNCCVRCNCCVQVGVDKEEASHLMGQLDFDVALKEIGEAAEHLHREGSPKVCAVPLMHRILQLNSVIEFCDVCVEKPGEARQRAWAPFWPIRVASPQIGITGFCMGGALALGGLAASDRIVAAAPFYGINRPTMMAGSGALPKAAPTEGRRLSQLLDFSRPSCSLVNAPCEPSL